MKRVVGIFLIALLGGVIALGLYKAFEKNQVPYSFSMLDRIPVSRTNYMPGAAFNEPDF